VNFPALPGTSLNPIYGMSIDAIYGGTVSKSIAVIILYWMTLSFQYENFVVFDLCVEVI
jgi:hypothetical protein